eukprot:gene10280-10439_t
MGVSAGSVGRLAGLPGATLAATMQQMQAPNLPGVAAAAAPAAAEGPLNVTSIWSQLALLYSWYASNRAVYLEQVQMLLQLADRDRVMAAALGPAAAAVGGGGGGGSGARPPALRALDKALEIIRGSQLALLLRLQHLMKGVAGGSGLHQERGPMEGGVASGRLPVRVKGILAVSEVSFLGIALLFDEYIVSHVSLNLAVFLRKYIVLEASKQLFITTRTALLNFLAQPWANGTRCFGKVQHDAFKGGTVKQRQGAAP